MKKVLILDISLRWGTHCGTSLEIVTNQTKGGNDTYYCNLGWYNLDEQSFTSSRVRSILDNVYYSHRLKKIILLVKQLGARIIDPPTLNGQSLWPIDLGALPSSLDELKNVKYKEVDVGLGIASSLISYFKDPYIDVTGIESSIIDRASQSIQLINWLSRIYEIFDFDEVFVFNGRYYLSRLVVDLAKRHQVNVKYHERGCDYTKFVVLENSPHDRAATRRRILDLWDISSDSTAEKINIAQDFFHRRRSGDSLGWHSFITNQEKGRVLDIKSNRIRIVYYSSSDDEYAAVGKYAVHPVFSSQRDCIDWLIDFVSRNKAWYDLIIRVHPHMAKKSTRDLFWWESLDGENVHVVPALSSVDSYSLLEHSDVVLCYGSTIGAEATYWGVPSINLGDAIYRGQGVAYEPTKTQELECLLSDCKSLNPKQKSNCYPYAYYSMTFGTPYRYYSPKDLHKGSFKDLQLSDSSPLVSIAKFFKRKL